ncbi:AraC family transcriptional regulator [Paraflavitalea sp. CAU 1676]|uniref:helix-turn-helix domain-containing protein n=1 Tax=Paraflavitalea sp. CAU 1676 TaxID=3032598 RepID=UPI0023DB1D37|nr:AraC family transcriptional regulator [Paraflavitalea sp. CAU 1676]MDF2190433.1 AraC family transcriptional regulator [Paraflavitalea sp. CAU 1676]
MQKKIAEAAQEKLKTAAVLILKDIHIHYSIPQLSRIVELDEPTLKYGFKQMYGTGPYEYLQVARLKEAASLIKETDLPIAEIAHRCGYNHATNLTAAFRRKFQMLPSDLRKKILPEA